MSSFKTRKIQIEEFGDKLKRARLRKKLTLEQVEIETTVRAKYLRAFEDEKFNELPANAYAIGYLEKYCDFLGLKKDEIIAQFRRSQDFFKSKADVFSPKHFREFSFVLTPRLFIISGIVLIAFIFFGYIWSQFSKFTAAPPLKILTPSEQQMVTTDTINVSGLTDEGAKLTINNEDVKIDEIGKFDTDVKLQDGVNTIEVVSENKVKKQSKKTLRILAKLK